MTKSKTKIDKQSQRKQNSSLVETIRSAKKTGNERWIYIAGVLSGPRRKKTAVNLNEIEKMSKEGDSILIPGKVLSQGDITKKIAVIALNFSEKAREKLLKTKSHALTIAEEIKNNPSARGIKILEK